MPVRRANPIEVVPHTQDLVPAVLRFNRRMQHTGWSWYEDPTPGWLAPATGQRAWREYWVAVERCGTRDDAQLEVRGAFALKPHEYLVHGQPELVTHWQGPLSEGLADPHYGMLALHLLREMLRKRPLLYSWGHGGRDAPIVRLLGSMPGWLLHWTPLSVRVLRPYRCLRGASALRRSLPRRAACDALALSGIGSLAIRGLQAAMAARNPARTPVHAAAHAEPFERFDAWADDVWQRCKDHYATIGVRDSSAMNAISPTGRWPHGIHLRIRRGDATIGWAIVLDTEMHDDHRFGDLRVGIVADCLAAPDDAPAVVAAALEHLADRGVDLVVANQAHPAWSRAFRTAGFLQVREGRLFAASPRLVEAMQPFAAAGDGLHLTNMDGEGPICLAP